MSNGHTSYWENGAAWPLYSDHNTQTFVLSTIYTLALTLSLSYLPFLADLLGLPWVLEEQEVVIFILLQMCLHAFQEHK